MADESTQTSGLTEHQQKAQAEAVERATKRLLKFAAAHNGPQYVYVEHISSTASRVIVVGQDGRWGDQVLPTYETANAVAARLGTEISEGEWSREAVGSIVTTAYEWGLMGVGRPDGK